MNFLENVSEFMPNSIYNPNERIKSWLFPLFGCFYEIGLFS